MYYIDTSLLSFMTISPDNKITDSDINVESCYKANSYVIVVLYSDVFQ